MISDLSDLVISPRETLDIELKAWVDLGDNIFRANIARHLAALANHGGGYLVFGINDDLTLSEPRPPSLSDYSRDTISAIIKRYLSPTFQCDVVFVSDLDGNEFPIVRVPSHGVAPIITIRGGPQDNKGRTDGIEAATYYIRKVGPESSKISEAKEWSELIRRCLVSDRERLLNDIAGLVTSGVEPVPTERELAAQWADKARVRFETLLEDEPHFGWTVPLRDNCYQLSYVIHQEGNAAIPVGSLANVLELVNTDLREVVWTGWSMFYPFTDPDLRPSIVPEEPDGSGDELLETALLKSGEYSTSLPDFWRIAPGGRATIIRAYREDRRRANDGLDREAGTWLAPITIIRETAELVNHARLLTQRFSEATAVSFHCKWAGLRNRKLKGFTDEEYWGEQMSKANDRLVEGTWSAADLSANWTAIVADLGCPVLRLFGYTDCGPALVKALEPKFKLL